MLAMNIDENIYDFRKKYSLRARALLYAPVADVYPDLYEMNNGHVVEINEHPSFERIISYEIIKYNKIWVLLGKAVCTLFESTAPNEYNKEVNFEIAMSLDKYQLLIWKYLHCVKVNKI